MYALARLPALDAGSLDQARQAASLRLLAELPRILALPRGDYVATLLSIGAVAGIAAQHAALLEASGARDCPAARLRLIEPGFGVAEIAGAAIDRHLTGSAPKTLWRRLEMMARDCGIPARSLPEPQVVARQLAGGGEPSWFGGLDLPGGRPVSAPLDATLAASWSVCRRLLRLKGPVFPPVPPGDWPAVTALAASEAARMHVAPCGGAAAISLVLGAALAASRRHPERNAPGSWRLEQRDGWLAVAELHAHGSRPLRYDRREPPEEQALSAF